MKCSYYDSKKLILTVLFAVVAALALPLSVGATENSQESKINNNIEDLEIVDESYEFKKDIENDIIFPVKIVDEYTNEDGKLVKETEPVDDFKLTNTGIEIDDKVVAKFPKSTDSDSMEPLCIACGCTYKDVETISRTTDEYNEFLMWHPDFDDYLEVSGYYFSNSSTSVGISIPGYYGVTFDVSYTPEGSGYYINTYDEDTPSRPYVEGDIMKHYYKVVEKRCNGTVIDSYYNTHYYVEDEQIKIAFE